MNKSISTFMGIAITAAIIMSLVIGEAYQSLKNKNDSHQELLETSHQLQKK